MAPPPKLNTDAVSEILLRLPPDDPAGLVRASAVCKTWLRTLTDPAFLRSYRGFHGTPHVLGFLHDSTDSGLGRFVPTTAFRPHAAAAAAHHTCYVLDCRHGHVLLYDRNELVLWDPVTGSEHRIACPDENPYTHHAVLCAAGAGCDHSTCSGGPFLVAAVGTRTNNCGESMATVYSSETGAWSIERSLCLPYYYGLEDWPAGLVGGALYFAGDAGNLLRYDVLGGHGLSVIDLPPGYSYFEHDPGYFFGAIVMEAGDGGLGLATFVHGMLDLWSAKTVRPYRANRWSHVQLINVQELLPTIDVGMGSAWLSGFAEDASLIFLSTADDGIFTVDLKSLLVRKVCEMGGVNHVFPYVSYYSPAGTASRSLQCMAI